VVYHSPLDVGEKPALRRLFTDLRGFGWSRSNGWVGQAEQPGRPKIDTFEAPATLYDGVVTAVVHAEGKESAAHVRGIELAGNGCEGPLSTSLGTLSRCTFLRLHWNLICGPLPPLPDLRLLTSLDLSANDLSGPLDASIQHLTSLNLLDLSFNTLTGPVPDIFDKLPSLTCLNLSGNYLTGLLPQTLSSLMDLQELKLYNNQFTGAIPLFPLGLPKLRTVNLSQNLLTSGLNNFNTCAKLETLNLSQNGLKDHLEASLVGLKRLAVLYVQYNQCGGFLPVELCTLTRLRRLNLAHNGLRGLIPHDIGFLTNLESLILIGNNIIGPVPLSIANLRKLRDFDVFQPYPSETSRPLFDKHAFKRQFVFGPRCGINSVHWEYEQVYGRQRGPEDDDSVTIFSGKL